MSEYATSPARSYLIPDLDDELIEVLRRVEELLLTLAGWEEDPDGPGPFVLPAPLAGRVALDALNRIQASVRATQTRTRTERGGREIPVSPGPGRGRLLGPDGRYEHRPLHLLDLDPADVTVLGAAAAALRHTLATAPGSELAAAIIGGAEAATDLGPAPSPSGVIIEGLARAHGLLHLCSATPRPASSVTSLLVVDPGDVTVLRARLVDAGGGDVVLSPAEEVAYARLADRMNAMWSGSALDRWTY